MVSPFAIRLTARSLGSIGVQSGRLYALSTLGSLLGTFGTTFVLLPLLSVDAILMVLGGSLALVPLFVLATARKAGAAAAAAIALSLVAWKAWGLPVATLQRGETLLFEASSPYHHVAVVERGDLRFLKFNDFYESGISLRPPYQSVFPYTDAFHVAALFDPAPERAVFLGAGGGIGPRDFAEVYPSLSRIDVVDVDPLVLEVAEKYFYLEPSERVRVHADDARMFLRRPGQGPWDLVVLDAFTIGGRIPFHLATEEAFRELRDRLTDDGVLVMNINSALEGPKAEIYRSLASTIRAAFGHVVAFPLVYAGERDPGSKRFREQSRNVILAAVKGTPPSKEELLARAAEAEEPRARKHAATVITEVPEGDVLTDGWAPIETMAF